MRMARRKVTHSVYYHVCVRVCHIRYLTRRDDDCERKQTMAQMAEIC